jgi:hypothetical protein
VVIVILFVLVVLSLTLMVLFFAPFLFHIFPVA